MSILSSTNTGIYPAVKKFADKFDATIEGDSLHPVVHISGDSNASLTFRGDNLICDILLGDNIFERNVYLMYFNNATIQKVRIKNKFTSCYSIQYSYCDIHNILEFEKNRTIELPKYENCKIYIYTEHLEKISLKRLEELNKNNCIKIEVDISKTPEINLFDTIADIIGTHYFISLDKYKKITQK